MRNCAGTHPNEQLRRERQRRGWSRVYVAERIGIADPKTLGRWERGVAFPSAYFLQKLCDLFEMLPGQLGILHEDAMSSQTTVHTLLADQHMMNAPLYDPTIPPPLAETKGLVGRDEVVQHLKQRLCLSNGMTLTALHGLPGVGKTAMAIELAYDSAIQQHFCDGVLWARLGTEADVRGHLERWGSLLGFTCGTMAKLTSKEAWLRAIRAAIGTRRILLIIDDAWTYQDALALKIGGPNCAYLLTTRIPSVALHFANDGALHIKEFDEEQGLDLLTHFAPELVSTERSAARTLVQSVGGLPLGLILLGKYFQSQTYSGQPRRLHMALKRLGDAKERLQLTILSSLEQYGDVPRDAPCSLAMAIETSVSQLDKAAQHALSLLSVFPARPYSFSEESALAISGASVETLDMLVDAGLLEVTSMGCYTLHQTIADYASMLLGDCVAYERMQEPVTKNLHPVRDIPLHREAGMSGVLFRDEIARSKLLIAAPVST